MLKTWSGWSLFCMLKQERLLFGCFLFLAINGAFQQSPGSKYVGVDDMMVFFQYGGRRDWSKSMKSVLFSFTIHHSVFAASVTSQDWFLFKAFYSFSSKSIMNRWWFLLSLIYRIIDNSFNLNAFVKDFGLPLCMKWEINPPPPPFLRHSNFLSQTKSIPAGLIGDSKLTLIVYGYLSLC